MNLKNALDAVHADIKKKMPDLAAKFDANTDQLISNGVGQNSPKAGDTAPTFELPDQLGRKISSADLLQKGPLVISFYRGNWCPYCNLELRALQQTLPQINELGATLIAISPQIPDESLTTAEKNELSFPVLSDVGNKVARQFGLVFPLAESLRPIYADLGIDLPKFNGTDTFELPVPATFIIDPDGTVRADYVNADYKQRMEPSAILKELAKIEK